MQTVGTYLKSSREAKNISLSEISHHTKISKWYLDCLEKDEFTKIPGGPYIKGYISSYAAFVGIDRNEAIKKYVSSNLQSQSTNQAYNRKILKNERFQVLAILSRKILILSLALIIIILLLAGGYHFIFKDPKDTKLEKTFRRPAQKESQSSAEQLAENPSEGSKFEKKNFDIQNTAPPENLEFVTDTLPKPVINQPATEKISKGQKGQIQPVAEDGIKVVKAVAGGGFQNKNPIDIGDSFQWTKEKIYIWSMIEFTNPPPSIKHIYNFKEQKISEVSLEVKSHLWRTWSYKIISDKRYIAQWRVDITSAEGKVLKTIRFDVS